MKKEVNSIKPYRASREDINFLEFIRRKHSLDSFCDRLVNDCESEFARLGKQRKLSAKSRTEIYDICRQIIQAEHDRNFREHAKIECNS